MKLYIKILYSRLKLGNGSTKKAQELQEAGNTLMREYLGRIETLASTEWDEGDNIWLGNYSAIFGTEDITMVVPATTGISKLIKTMVTDCEADLETLRKESDTIYQMFDFPRISMHEVSSKKPEHICRSIREFFGWTV